MFGRGSSSSSIRRDVMVVRRHLGVIEKIKWRLLSDRKKIEILRSRGLVMGEGCEILNGFDFGSEPYLVKIGNNVRIAGGEDHDPRWRRLGAAALVAREIRCVGSLRQG